MTGLDPKRHQIVELATVVTDDELNLVATGPDIVIGATDVVLEAMDPFVVNMHTQSGLLAEIKSSTVTLSDAQAQTLEFLRANISQSGLVPLCGNTIGTDRRFLAEQATEIDEFLHYRSIDVSSVKELARRWHPEILKGAPVKKRGHRALDDILESIEELKYYKECFFRLRS